MFHQKLSKNNILKQLLKMQLRKFVKNSIKSYYLNYKEKKLLVGNCLAELKLTLIIM